MGAVFSSSKISVVNGCSISSILKLQAIFDANQQMTLDVQVAHFTPSFFPITPIVDKSTMAVCNQSWEKILMPVQRDGKTLSGLTVFYTEFYQTLSLLDSAGKFEAILKHHAPTGMNDIAAKGAILVRIIDYSLSLDIESDQCMYMLYNLGVSHNHKQIRPWQYSVFIQTLINTISSCLGPFATQQVMSAWSNLFAFILRSMLPVAIKGMVNETEISVKVTQEISTNSVVCVEIVEADKKIQSAREESQATRHMSSYSHSENSSVRKSYDRRNNFPLSSRHPDI